MTSASRRLNIHVCIKLKIWAIFTTTLLNQLYFTCEGLAFYSYVQNIYVTASFQKEGGLYS
jgi:hypothetical protein